MMRRVQSAGGTVEIVHVERLGRQSSAAPFRETNAECPIASGRPMRERLLAAIAAFLDVAGCLPRFDEFCSKSLRSLSSWCRVRSQNRQLQRQILTARFVFFVVCLMGSRYSREAQHMVCQAWNSRAIAVAIRRRQLSRRRQGRAGDPTPEPSR